MNDEISWHVELALSPQRSADFISLTKDMIESTKLEDGVLAYERFINDDRTKILVYERYMNSESAIKHLRAFHEKFGNTFAKLVKRENFFVFGYPNTELREILSNLGAEFLNPLGGFSKFTEE